MAKEQAAMIKINDKEYKLDKLSDGAKGQLQGIHGKLYKTPINLLMNLVVVI